MRAGAFELVGWDDDELPPSLPAAPLPPLTVSSMFERIVTILSAPSRAPCGFAAGCTVSHQGGQRCAIGSL
jgi:hypothetical protein